MSSEIATPGPWSKELIREIAMDIGKEVVAYIEVSDEGKIKSRLRDRKEFRREWTAAYRKFRKATP